MGTPKKLSKNAIALARMARGKNPKKPKKPTGTKTLKKIEDYITRYNAWVDKINERAKEGKKIQAEKDKLAKAKSQLAGL